jgi:purine-cytosine permease-like protein
VPQHELKGWKSFLGMYAGEHAAGTEFMIGPLFLASGVSAFDLIVGLLLGNLLAVLSWRFITAPIAVRHRLSLYAQLEKIAGKRLVVMYNIANGILFCALAGAMVTVSATAVGIPFQVDMPGLDEAFPKSSLWIGIVLLIGILFTWIARMGYHSVAQAANWMSPIIALAFLACGAVAIKQLDLRSLSDFWQVWGDGGEAFPGQIKFGFWHVVIWSWCCNAAMHLGMADLSVFRYAKKASLAWATAAGMYLGHYMAWIAAALLYAVYLRSPEAMEMMAGGQAPPVNPGSLAYQALGIFGAIAVVMAGWTTANPTIYRAGLAFQSISSHWKRGTATLAAGVLATVAGIFPAFAMKLLGFVAFYGFVLAPVGAIIFVQHYFGHKWHTPSHISFNKAILLAWALSVGIFYSLSTVNDIFLSFVIVPAWVLSGVLYALFSRALFGKRMDQQPAT